MIRIKVSASLPKIRIEWPIKRRCNEHESGGFRCERPAGHEKSWRRSLREHWISDATIRAHADTSGPWAPDPPHPEFDPWA